MSKRKKVSLAGIDLFAIVSLSGCSLAGKNLYFTTGLGKNEVFKINGSVCDKSNAMLLLSTEKNLYENAYGKDIWKREASGTTLEDYVKNNVKSELAEMKTMSLLAKDNKIKLSEEEKTNVNQFAEKYINGLSDTEKKYMNVDLDDAKEMYTEYFLTNKVYEELTKDVNPEISDSDAKVIKVQSIYLKTYTIDGNEKRTEYTDNEKKDVKSKMENIVEQINSGGDFSALAANNTDASSVEYQFGRGEMIKEFEDAAFALSSGQTSEIIDTPDGYYVIKCISDYMEDETQNNKKQIIKKMKDEAFKAIYEPFAKKVTSEFNDELWDSISFEEMKDIKVSNFYSILATQ